MKKQIIYWSLFLGIVACKKNQTTTPPPTNGGNTLPAYATEQLTPQYETDYGSGSDFAHMGSNPVTVLSSGNLIISSVQFDGAKDKLLITKTNANGGLLWQKTITKGFNLFSGQAFETNAGEIIIIGGSEVNSGITSSNVYIAKLNSTTGDTIWTKRYGHQYIDKGIVGYEAADNTYWIVDFWNQNNKAALLHIGANGDSLSTIINTETSFPIYRDAMISSAKKIILVGDSYIGSYTNGVKDFSSAILLDSLDMMRVNDVCETSDGAYVISGEAYKSTNTTVRYGFLVKVNTSGIKVWERIIKVSSGDQIYSCVEKTPDLFYLSIGSYNSTLLYNFDMTTTHVVNSATALTGATDAQLNIKNNLLYRSEFGYNSSSYFTIKLKAYPITF